jgi:hypothetical protein
VKKHNNSAKKSEPTSKRAKSRGPMRRDTKEVLAELVGKLKEKLDPKKVAATSAGEEHPRGELRPNLDRLTVGVDLGDQWSNYCILGLEGETLAEGQLRPSDGFFEGAPQPSVSPLCSPRARLQKSTSVNHPRSSTMA